MKVGRWLSVEQEPYGPLVLRGKPGQCVEVDPDDVDELCAALRLVNATPRPAPKVLEPAPPEGP